MSIQRLPVIVGFGGINAAGRASGHHAYNRMVQSVLPTAVRERSLSALARLMGMDPASADQQYLLDHSLVRRIETSHFDVNAVPWNRRISASSKDEAFSFNLKKQNLPEHIPENWQVSPLSDTHLHVQIDGEQNFLLPTRREFDVKAAGQLPTGFDPGKLYPSRSHPRALQMMVYAASDALGSIGIELDTIFSNVSADEVSVYAGSAMGQLDAAGAGGMLKARSNGLKVSSKNCPLGLAEMPADFINAYVLGTMGSTGASLGACASFLYNLRHGIEDIRSGRSRVAFIGSTETPINPEVMDGYHAMGALASDRGLRQLDGLSPDIEPDYRRACRPFAENCGFTVAESSQMVVLFDDQLAMQLGATMFASPLDVFINADGYKKSIAGPGIGNYITMAKAVASARAILGGNAIRNNGMVQAHGTGTPQNRVTETHILNETAKAFGIDAWPVAAIKSYLGHSLGSAAGDQLTATLGIWQHGWIPGIHSIEEVAADISHDKLSINPDHQQVDPKNLQYSILNSKGFGGNNASAALLSPDTVKKMLQQRYSASEWKAWENANESVRKQQLAYDERMIAGSESPVYKFDHGVLDGDDVKISDREITIAGKQVSLDLESPYEDIQIS
ncbi:MAG: beta-ketoacyl synthase [Proteobacteria bacterium]|nr:beta-ketoacyl synthase [Pseudomonadota bacterium]